MRKRASRIVIATQGIIRSEGRARPCGPGLDCQTWESSNPNPPGAHPGRIFAAAML